VSGTGEGDEHKDGEDTLEPEVGGEGECHQCQGDAHEELHRNNPPAFCFEVVDDRTPNGLDHPRKTEPTRVERDLLVSQSQFLEHDDRNEHHS